MTFQIGHSNELGYEGDKVYFNDAGNGDELQPGQVICMDPSEDMEPGTDEWKEQQLGRVFVKPATANLHMPKAIVVGTPQRLKHRSISDYSSRDVRIVWPKPSKIFYALVNNNVDVNAGDLLGAVDGQFYLQRIAIAGTDINTNMVARVIKDQALSGESGPILVRLTGV